MAAGTIKIVAEVVIEVNRNQWELEYGTGESVSEIRESIKASISDGLKISTFAHLTPEVITRLDIY